MKKNPLLAGLLNMLVPGSVYWYVDKDRGRFLKTLGIGIAAIVVMVVLGNAIQHTKGYPLPQGLCMGILLLIVFVPLFLNGQKTASQHNFVADNATLYNTRQTGSNETQLTRNQIMRDKGLISKQEYDSRKKDITSKE